MTNGHLTLWARSTLSLPTFHPCSPQTTADTCVQLPRALLIQGFIEQNCPLSVSSSVLTLECGPRPGLCPHKFTVPSSDHSHVQSLPCLLLFTNDGWSGIGHLALSHSQSVKYAASGPYSDTSDLLSRLLSKAFTSVSFAVITSITLALPCFPTKTLSATGELSSRPSF